MSGTLKKLGACHCGAVAFEAEMPDEVEAHACNCSICRASGMVQVILPLGKFRLLRGEDNLTTYRFNTGVARHTFCSVCGCKPFYFPRSNPDGVSVNVNCMDEAQFTEIRIIPFDGQNWEENAGALAHLSQDL